MNVKARIKRNKLDELSGAYYRDDKSDLIIDLKGTGKDVFVGIQREDGIYTVIGKNFVFYSTKDAEYEIPNNEFVNLLMDNAMKLGKNGDFEFIKTNSGTMIWMLNGPTMNAFWNTVMLFTKSSD